jgi:hypothetical protein
MAGPYYQFTVPPSMVAITAIVCDEHGVEGGVTAPGGTDGSGLGTQLDWLHVTGVVRAADGASDCGAVVPNAELHVWQADWAGHYDSHTDESSWDCRAVLFADLDGRYSYLTLKPGPYTGRPTHIHLKVFAAGFHELTTQLYFDEEPAGCGPGQASAGSCADDLIVGFSGVGTLGTEAAPRTGTLDLRLVEDVAQARWLGEGNPCDEGSESSLCDVHAMCVHTGPGVHRCECLDGYEGNGGHCVEAPESGEACEYVGTNGEAAVGVCGTAAASGDAPNSGAGIQAEAEPVPAAAAEAEAEAEQPGGVTVASSSDPRWRSEALGCMLLLKLVLLAAAASSCDIICPVRCSSST